MRRDERFEAFVLEHYDDLFRYALVLTGSRDDAEDLVHDSLLKLHQHIGRGDIRHERAYARQTVFSVFLRARRRWVREHTRSEQVAPQVHDDFADTITGRDEVLLLLVQLPRRTRAVIAARFYLDLSEQDTATLLGCSVGTVKSSASRGLARLRELSSGTATTVNTSVTTR